MRLLRYNSSDDAFEVVNCSKDDILPYTILSYSWTTDREVKCEDLLAGARKSKANYAKIPSPESSERLSHYDGRQLRVYEIPCQVGKRKTKALGDTGAKHNFMRVSTARKWRLSVDLMMKRKVIVGSGKEVESPGTATAWFRFPREPQTYQLVFQLLPECVHDVILGKSFLKLSKTFTDAANFVKRVKERVIQGLQHFDLLYISGSTGPMFEGSLADKYQRALADTGAKVAVLDEDHAQKLGISFDVGFEHCNTLRFADDSRATTSGTAYGVPWRFGNDSMFYNLDFHVLKDAPAEVILPDTLLLDTMAFSKYAEFLIDDDDDGDDFSHCFLIDQDLKRQIQGNLNTSLPYTSSKY